MSRPPRQRCGLGGPQRDRIGTAADRARKRRRRPRVEPLESRLVLSITALGQTLRLVEGQAPSPAPVVARFTDTDPSPPASYTVRINWGDGSPTQADITPRTA